MWLVEWLSCPRPLWRKVTDRRLANHQGDLLRIEAKVDDDHFRLHKTLGELSRRLDDQAITLGQLAHDLAREQKHLNMAVRAADLIVMGVKDQRRRIEKLEERAAEADRQIVSILRWAGEIVKAEPEHMYGVDPPMYGVESAAPELPSNL